MMFSAVEKTIRRTTMKRIFATDVIQSVLMSQSPTCKSTPVTAKIAARRKRGSARNSPFQLDCIAHSERGRYVSQKKIPVRPNAADQRWKPVRRVINPTNPAAAAATKASSAARTQAPCRYTIRTLAPRAFSSGPNNARRAITITVAKNKMIGDLSLGIA